jgi:hypothetical protein
MSPLRALFAELRDLLADRLLARHRARVAEAVREERRALARHSRRLVTPAEARARRLAPVAPLTTGGYGAWASWWRGAALFADVGRYDWAAVQVIAASGNGVARVVETEEAR